MKLTGIVVLILAAGFVGTVSRSDDVAAKKPWKKIVVAVAAPAHTLTKVAAKPLEPLVAKAAKAVGADADAAKKVLNIGTDPAPTIIEMGKETMIHIRKGQVESLTAKLAFIDGVIHGDLKRMGEAFVQIIGAEVQKGLSPPVLYVINLTTALIPEPDRGGLMEKPDIELVEPSVGSRSLGLGDPRLVFYVNGMQTSREQARDEARALAERLNRPVGLVYNDTQNLASDSVQAIYDRAWPMTLTANVPIAGVKVRQQNRTTRQITHLLHHASGNISIVSHSQGCLIVRNALLTASRMRSGGEPERRVRWVATGVPMRNEEVLVIELAKYTPLANKDDPVSQGLGLRLMAKEDGENRGRHDFISAYVNQIKPDHLW